MELHYRSNVITKKLYSLKNPSTLTAPILCVGAFDQQCTQSTVSSVTVVLKGPPKVAYIHPHYLSQLLHRSMAMPITRRGGPRSSTVALHLQAVAVSSVHTTALLLASIISCICRPKCTAAHEHVEALGAASAHLPHAGPVPFQLLNPRAELFFAPQWNCSQWLHATISTFT